MLLMPLRPFSSLAFAADVDLFDVAKLDVHEIVVELLVTTGQSFDGRTGERLGRGQVEGAEWKEDRAGYQGSDIPGPRAPGRAARRWAQSYNAVTDGSNLTQQPRGRWVCGQRVVC